MLIDVDEHTGNFGGAKTYFAGPDSPSDVAGIMIGYPGTDKLVVGGRGVHRAQLQVSTSLRRPSTVAGTWSRVWSS